MANIRFPTMPEALCVRMIEIFPSLYPSKFAYLNRILCEENNGWKDGCPIPDKIDSEYLEQKDVKDEILPIALATNWYKYGDQKFCFKLSPPNTYTSCHLLSIPGDVHPKWLEAIQDFCRFVNKIDLDAYKLYVYSQCAAGGMTVAVYLKDNYDRDINDFNELRKVTNKICIERDWKYFTTEEMFKDSERKTGGKIDYNQILKEIIVSLGVQLPPDAPKLPPETIAEQKRLEENRKQIYEANVKEFERFAKWASPRLPNLLRRAFNLRKKSCRTDEIERWLGVVLQRINADSFGSVYDREKDSASQHAYVFMTKMCFNDAWKDIIKEEMRLSINKRR